MFTKKKKKNRRVLLSKIKPGFKELRKSMQFCVPASTQLVLSVIILLLILNVRLFNRFACVEN
jgi:hypothetical protein